MGSDAISRRRGELRGLRTRARAATLLAGTIALGLASAGGAAAATPASPPQIAGSFTPNVIAQGGTTALGFTLTNPNATGSLSNVSFTDTLPAGVVVDTQPGTTIASACNSKTVQATVTATAGTSTIAVTGATLAANDAANPCTISVAVTSNAVGTVQNSTGPVTATGTAAGAASVGSLTVAGLPTVSSSAPRNGATLNYKQKVHARFGCQEGTLGPGLIDCSAQDDLGNTVESGGLIDTSVPGAHTLTISASSADGEVTSDTINYTVLPDNLFTVSHVAASSNGSITLSVKVPGSGLIAVLASAPLGDEASVRLTPGRGWFAFGELKKKVHHAGTFKLTITPNGTGSTSLAAHGSFALKVAVAYTPTHGRIHITDVPGITVP